MWIPTLHRKTQRIEKCLCNRLYRCNSKHGIEVQHETHSGLGLAPFCSRKATALCWRAFAALPKAVFPCSSISSRSTPCNRMTDTAEKNALLCMWTAANTACCCSACANQLCAAVNVNTCCQRPTKHQICETMLHILGMSLPPRSCLAGNRLQTQGMGAQCEEVSQGVCTQGLPA